MKTFFAAVIVGTVICSNVYAEEPPLDAKICNAVLASGIRDNYDLLTVHEQFDLYQKRLCDAEFQTFEQFSKGASEFGLDFSYAKVALGLSSSSQNEDSIFKESYKNFCESTYFNSKVKDLFHLKTSTVSAALASSWLQCQKSYLDTWLSMNEKGMFISAIPQSDFRDFTVQVHRRTPSAKPLKIHGITPDNGSVTCLWEGKKFGHGSIVKDLNEFSITCTKGEHKQIAFGMSTSEGNTNTVIMPSQTSKIQELNDRLQTFNNSLEQKIKELTNELSNINSQLKAAKEIADSNNNAITNLNLNTIKVNDPIQLFWEQQTQCLFPHGEAGRDIVTTGACGHGHNKFLIRRF